MNGPTPLPIYPSPLPYPPLYTPFLTTCRGGTIPRQKFFRKFFGKKGNTPKSDLKIFQKFFQILDYILFTFNCILLKNIIHMKKIILLFALIIGISFSSFSQDQYIGEIRLFAGNYPPKGWAFCNGQLLSIQQYTAVFAILGTYYGGDGRSNFALPDLRGRVPVHSGNSMGIGLSRPVVLGEKGGEEVTTVNPPLVSVSTNGIKLDAATTGRDGVPTLVTSVVVNNGTVPQKLDNRSPYLGLNYIICLEGYFPTRD